MRLERIQAPNLDYQYTDYDNVGNLLTKSTEHGNYVYGYDEVYRLTSTDNPTLGDEAYTYDGVGNRETASGVTGSITHNTNNELTVYGEISYDYDANGNMISKTSASENWAYSYNVQNRLVQVEEDDLLVAEYGYDPFGRRLWKDVGGTRTYFFYSEEGLIAEYDASGTEIKSYGYRPDSTWGADPLWLKENDEYYWYQNDHLGTPQKLVDSSGTVVWSATYTAFGEAVVDVETVTNNLRFPGQYEDAETELHYNWFRYYDPRIGRYVRIDPIGFAARDVNLYAYVWNDPVNWIDFDGLKIQLVGTVEEKKRLIEVLNRMADTKLKVDESGNILPDFIWSPKFKKIDEWLYTLLISEKLFKIQFDDVIKKASFDCLEGVKLDHTFKDPNQKNFYYRGKPEGWLIPVAPHHYYTAEGVLAHELLGHGLDWELGGPCSLREVSDAKKKASLESRAIGRANTVRALLGLPLRYQ